MECAKRGCLNRAIWKHLYRVHPLGENSHEGKDTGDTTNRVPEQGELETLLLCCEQDFRYVYNDIDSIKENLLKV